MRKKLIPASLPTMSKLIIVLILPLCFSITAYCQTVTGTVRDEESKPVSQATVAVKGTTKATVTDVSGSFTIVAGANDVLLITHVNYLDQEIPLSGRTSVSIS